VVVMMKALVIMIVTFVVMVMVMCGRGGRESFFGPRFLGRGVLLDCVSGGQWICLPEFVGEDWSKRKDCAAKPCSSRIRAQSARVNLAESL